MFLLPLRFNEQYIMAPGRPSEMKPRGSETPSESHLSAETLMLCNT